MDKPTHTQQIIDQLLREHAPEAFKFNPIAPAQTHYNTGKATITLHQDHLIYQPHIIHLPMEHTKPKSPTILHYADPEFTTKLTQLIKQPLTEPQ